MMVTNVSPPQQVNDTIEYKVNLIHLHIIFYNILCVLTNVKKNEIGLKN